MHIEYIKTTHNYRIARLCGEMDALGCTEIHDELEQIIGQEIGPNIALDLSDVSFLNSSGISLIVYLFKRLKSQSRALQIIGATGQPQELIHMLRLESAVPVNSSLDLGK